MNNLPDSSIPRNATRRPLKWVPFRIAPQAGMRGSDIFKWRISMTASFPSEASGRAAYNQYIASMDHVTQLGFLGQLLSGVSVELFPPNLQGFYGFHQQAFAQYEVTVQDTFRRASARTLAQHLALREAYLLLVHLVSQEGPRQAPISAGTGLASAYIAPDGMSRGIEYPWELFAQAIPCDAVDVVLACLTQMRNSGYRFECLGPRLITLLQEMLRQIRMRDNCDVGSDGRTTVLDQRLRAEDLALTLATLDFEDPSQASLQSFVKSSLHSLTPGTSFIWLRTLQSLAASSVRGDGSTLADVSMGGTTPPRIEMAPSGPVTRTRVSYDHKSGSVTPTQRTFDNRDQSIR